MPCRHTEANHTATPLLQTFEIAASIPIDSPAEFVRTSTAPISQTEALTVETLYPTLSGTFIPSCPGCNPRDTTPISIQSMLNTSWPVCKDIAKAWKWQQIYWYTHILCLSLQSWHFKSVCCRNAHAALSPYLSYQPPCKLLQIKSTQMKLLSCTIIIMCNDKSRWTVAFIHTLQLTHSGVCLDFAATLLSSCLIATDGVTLCGVEVPLAADHQQVSDRILQLSIPNCTWTSLKRKLLCG